jgi:hypothetical protein
MRIFEFAGDNPLSIKLAAVAKQLQDRVEKTGQSISTDQLLNFLRQNDIILDKPDLFDIVQKEPLKNIIKNVNKDEVTFVGQEDEDDMALDAKPDEAEKVRQQMAKSAMK